MAPYKIEDNTSGYVSMTSLSSTLSASLLESSFEERRLAPNKVKNFQVLSCLSKHVDTASGPQCSTPKQGSEIAAMKMRVQMRRPRTPSFKADKTIVARKISTVIPQTNTSTTSDATSDVCFWEISSRLQKSCSEGDLYRPPAQRPIHEQRTCSHDSGLESLVKKSCTQNWKRRPFVGETTMDMEQRKYAIKAEHRGEAQYTRLSRYRVTVQEDTYGFSAPTKRNSANDIDSALGNDESMKDFLSRVNKDNLAGFINFYDRMTCEQPSKRSRRN
ncbi:hypothetical protein DPMN_010224 [Dreissena polymorpha]|uniref:Uncharacterized protein n=1 Tax=Dreissena polymorpha TaxID=45954 RepID=A0A9D4N1Q7_DREPO|nr:hypothetical protein DPMN_010224 [Dreissena polymorpha]